MFWKNKISQKCGLLFGVITFYTRNIDRESNVVFFVVDNKKAMLKNNIFLNWEVSRPKIS